MRSSWIHAGPERYWSPRIYFYASLPQTYKKLLLSGFIYFQKIQNYSKSLISLDSLLFFKQYIGKEIKQVFVDDQEVETNY